MKVRVVSYAKVGGASVVEFKGHRLEWLPLVDVWLLPLADAGGEERLAFVVFMEALSHVVKE